MDVHNAVRPTCATHGFNLKRECCLDCNAAYMRLYQKERRRKLPGLALWERARKRALVRNLAFDLNKGSIFVPERCPALGLPLIVGKKRSANSPSLDRINPSQGYVVGNVRVICDRANRLKGACSLAELKCRAESSAETLRSEYRMLATYVEREHFLQAIRRRTNQSGEAGQEWKYVASLLNQVFQEPIPSSV